MGGSVHDCVEITPLRASGGAYGAIGGAVHNCVEKVHIRDRWDGRISLGDGRPSARCGNVAVVALFLLIKRKMLFHRV